jgi:hypothetical protein
MVPSADQEPRGRTAGGDDGESERDRELPRVKIAERVFVQVITISCDRANRAAVDRPLEEPALQSGEIWQRLGSFSPERGPLTQKGDDGLLLLGMDVSGSDWNERHRASYRDSVLGATP